MPILSIFVTHYITLKIEGDMVQQNEIVVKVDRKYRNYQGSSGTMIYYFFMSKF